MEQPELPEPPDYIPFRWAGEDARLAGDLVHRILQLIAEEGSAAWRQKGGFIKNGKWCRQQLQSGGIRGTRADRILQRIERAVNVALESKTGRWLLADHQEADCEYALTAVLKGRPVNLVLDRTFVHGGERWIIDYKTSDHEGGSLEDFLKSEADRYREQLERYRRAMALNEKRPIRTALYFPLLDHFLEI
jgi:ATP-dependent exoDNAse (exonuclease V) beta subunit